MAGAAGRRFAIAATTVDPLHRKVTYTEGTNMRTESKDVFSASLFKLANADDLLADATELRGRATVPASAMHSFESDHNSVLENTR